MLRFLLSLIAVWVLTACATRTVPQATVDEFQGPEIVFHYDPSTDLGPSVTYTLEICGEKSRLVKRTIGWGVNTRNVVPLKIADAESEQLAQRVLGIPSGYWNRTIPYNDPNAFSKPDALLHYAPSPSSIVITIHKADGSKTSISVDGFDERLRNLFLTAEKFVPSQERFELEPAIFTPSDKDAQGEFFWKFIPPED